MGASKGQHELVRAVLAGARPPTSLPASIRTERWLPILGMYVRARGLLRSLLVLSEAGRANVGGELFARAIFELAATALWLDSDLPTNTKRFLQGGNRELALLADAVPEFGPRHTEALERWRVAYGEEQAELRLPPVEQRLVAPMAEHYPRYRLLSSLQHPGLVLLDHTLVVNAFGGINVHEDAHEPWPKDSQLTFAAMHVWLMAVLVTTRLEQTPTADYMGLGTELNDLLTGEAVQAQRDGTSPDEGRT